MIYQSDLYYCMLLSYIRNEEFRSILHLALRNTTTTTTAPAASAAAAATTSVADMELDEPPAPKRPHLRTGRGAPGIARKRIVSVRQKRRRKQRGIRPPTPTTQPPSQPPSPPAEPKVSTRVSSLPPSPEVPPFEPRLSPPTPPSISPTQEVLPTQAQAQVGDFDNVFISSTFVFFRTSLGPVV